MEYEFILHDRMRRYFPALHALARRGKNAFNHVVWTLSYDRLIADAMPTWTAKLLLESFNEKGIAFIHVPRTGGTSIGNALYNRGIEHWSCRNLRNLAPVDFDRWLKVAIVREPVDRFLSAYDFLAYNLTKPKKVGGPDAYFAHRFLRGTKNANEFISLLSDPRFRSDILRWYHFHPQCLYVLSPNGQIMVNQLIPFERLNDKVPGLIGTELPKLNPTVGARTSRKALTDGSLSKLNEIYAKDFVLHRLAMERGDDVLDKILQPTAPYQELE